MNDVKRGFQLVLGAFLGLMFLFLVFVLLIFADAASSAERSCLQAVPPASTIHYVTPCKPSRGR